jgi:signal transduction histidine kinase
VPYREISDTDLLHRLLEAILAIGRDKDLGELLLGIVEQAVALTGAKYGALGIFDEEAEGLSEFISVGLSEEERSAMTQRPEGLGVLKQTLESSRPLRIADLHTQRGRAGFPEHHPVMSSFLGVSVRLGDGEVFGSLYLCDKLDGSPFDETDEELVDALGKTAGILIEKMKLRLSLRDLSVARERERIARDLHDDVIQRLFAVGLNLQSLAGSTSSEIESARLRRAVDDLDETIHEIRSTIFAINHPSEPGELQRRLSDLCDEVSTRSELSISIHASSSLEEHVDATLAAHVLTALREALSNVVRHAGAKSVEVEVEASAEQVVLRVADDGCGVDPGSQGSGLGLRNLAERAASCGGWCELSSSTNGGSLLTWCASPSSRELTP